MISLAWLIAGSLLLSKGLLAIPAPLAEAIADAAYTREEAALAVALAWTEGGYRVDALGDNGHSYCAFQIHLPAKGQRTREGWTGDELRADPVKCVTVGLRLIRTSLEVCGNLALYTRGRCTSVEGKKLAAYRHALARKVLALEDRNEEP